MTVDFLGVIPDGSYRVVPEENVLRGFVGGCWYVEARRGQWDWAMVQAAEVVQRWVRLGLPYRLEGGRRLFDPCEMGNFSLWASRYRGDPFFREVGVPLCRRLVQELNPAGLPQDGTSQPSAFVLDWRREFNLRGSPSGRVVRLRVPMPLESHGCKLTAVRLVEPDGAIVAKTGTPGRLEIQLKGKVRPERVVVEVQICFRAWAQSWAVDPNRLQDWDRTTPEYQLYTRRAEGYIQVSRVLAQLADSLAGNCRNAWEAVQAFWRFFFERLIPGYVHHDQLDPIDPLGGLLQSRWVDCYTGSAILAALCRARGIPARIVNGILLHLDRPARHYWLEVLLPPYGWVPLDTYSWPLADGHPDLPPWSTFFLGRLDPRMTCECLPRLTLGYAGVRFPRSWYTVPDYYENGTETAYCSLHTRQLLYRDQIRVRREPGAVVP